MAHFFAFFMLFHLNFSYFSTKLLINIWLSSQTDFQLKKSMYKQVFCLNCP